MAKSQQHGAVMTGSSSSSYAPIREVDEDQFEIEQALSGNGCFASLCRNSSCFGWGRRRKINNQETGSSNNYLLRRRNQNGGGDGDGEDDGGDSWVVKKLKELKEFSEVVAGPKWKNLIRKYFKTKKTRNHTCNYTPQSYALNFEEDDLLFRNFSSRFSAPHQDINHQQQKINVPSN